MSTLFNIAIPRIGSFWREQGGIYAGIVAGENGEPDYHLIHASSEHEIFEVDFSSAIEAAKTPFNGFQDWYLPTRRDARLLTINCRDSFDLDDWYWTSTQGAHYDDYAWMQEFTNGTQLSYHKSNTDRARAVRRVYLPVTADQEDTGAAA